MRKTTLCFLVLAPALSAALAMPAAIASAAATTWTVKPGGAVTATSGQVTLKDATTESTVTCLSSDIKATLRSGTGLPGTGIGSISSFTFAKCSGPLGIQYTLTFSHSPFKFNATSYNSGTGTTTATIAGIHGKWAGPTCSFVLDGTGATQDNGTMVVTYVNSTHKLKFLTTGGDLHVYDLLGCGALGEIHNHDRLTFSATGTVTPAQTITSP
jgi:hypothetical protein